MPSEVNYTGVCSIEWAFVVELARFVNANADRYQGELSLPEWAAEVLRENEAKNA